MTMKRSLFAALVAVSALALSAENSMAFWGSGGRWGSCGSCGGSWHCCGSWGCGSWGCCGSWRGCRSWCGCGSWGCCGSWCSHGSYGSYGGYATYSYGGYARGYVVGERIVSSSPSRATIAQSSAKTRLTLRVPAEAKVTLAGVATKQTGEVRQFSTGRLASGQVWDEYKVVVEMEQGGRMLREERAITLTGGQAQELSISFDSQQIAQLTR